MKAWGDLPVGWIAYVQDDKQHYAGGQWAAIKMWWSEEHGMQSEAYRWDEVFKAS